jgi:hypothetical protein
MQVPPGSQTDSICCYSLSPPRSLGTVGGRGIAMLPPHQDATLYIAVAHSGCAPPI